MNCDALIEIIMKEVGLTNTDNLDINRYLTREITMKGLGLINEGRQHLLLLHKQKSICRHLRGISKHPP